MQQIQLIDRGACRLKQCLDEKQVIKGARLVYEPEIYHHSS